MTQDVYVEAKSLIQCKKLGEGTYSCVDLCTLKGMKVAVKTLKPALLESERDLRDFFHEAALLQNLRHPGIVKFVGVAFGVRDCNNGLLPTSETKQLLCNGSMSKMAYSQLNELMRLKSPRPVTNTKMKPVLAENLTNVTSKVVPSYLKEVKLVQEFMNKGTLKDIVLKQMSQPMKRIYSRAEGLDWLIQIAKGLRYVHNARPKIVHRDLKLDNILLTLDVAGDIVAKIGDFGLHAILKDCDHSDVDDDHSIPQNNNPLFFQDSFYRDESFTSIKAFYDLSGRTGSMMYMAPEVLHHLPYNEKADVFSFSMIMFEVRKFLARLIGRNIIRIQVLNKILLLTLVSHRGIPEELEDYAYGIGRGNRPAIPQDWPSSFSTILRQCWDHNPSNRPTMNVVVDVLEELKYDDWIEQDRCVQRCGCCALQ